MTDNPIQTNNPISPLHSSNGRRYHRHHNHHQHSISPSKRQQQSTEKRSHSQYYYSSTTETTTKALSKNKNHPISLNLSWRLDPIESLSDWTLVVISNEHAGEEKVVPPTSTEFDNTSEISELSDKPDGNTTSEKKAPITSLSYASNASHIKPCKRYYVHKAVLGVGPRKGSFFADIFHKHRLASMVERNDNDNDDDDDDESEDQRDQKNTKKDLEPITHLEVKPSAAAAFEAMLDFMYASNDTPVKATTENAVALRHLSIALGIRELFNNVTPFIQKNLSAQTSPIYLFEAHRYNHEKLLNVALKICASNFEEIKLSSIIILHPDLLRCVLMSPHLKCDSEILSSRIASYFRCRPKSINKDNLLEFTSPELMPIIAPDEVLFYLTLMEETGLLLRKDRRNASFKNSSLYERCMASSPETICAVMAEKLYPRINKAISPSGREKHKKKSIELELDNLSPRIRADLLEKALLEKMASTAGNNTTIIAPPKKTHHNKNDTYMAPFHTFAKETDFESKSENRKKQTRKTQKNTHRVKYNEYRAQLSDLEAQLAEKERIIQQYKNELSKFVRVPNRYELPPLLSDHTYKREPLYDSYGESIYGYIPPTALPRVGNQSSDGWVFREERRDDGGGEGGNDNFLWPMYYYQDSK